MDPEYIPDLNMLRYIMQANRKKGNHKVYLFLDFDGVINVFYQQGTPEYEEMMQQPSDSYDFASRKCVRYLDQFTQDYPVAVIISSSWRYDKLPFCLEYLKHAGLKNTSAIVDTTQTETFQSREADIEQYLLAHPDFSGFLIFDDMRMPHFRQFHVQTNSYQGWNEERDQYARNIMKKF